MANLSDLFTRHRPDVLDHVRNYLAAAWEDPRGLRCGWCGRPNFFCDDLGWFHIAPVGDDCRATCRRCYHGEPGRLHVARYGVGER